VIEAQKNKANQLSHKAFKICGWCALIAIVGIPGSFLLLDILILFIFGPVAATAALIGQDLVLIGSAFFLALSVISLMVAWTSQCYCHLKYVKHKQKFIYLAVPVLIPLIFWGLSYWFINTYMNSDIQKNIQSTQHVGCLNSTQLNNTYTPVDLIESYARCLQEGKSKDAELLRYLAHIYINFDRDRVQDDTYASQIQNALLSRETGKIEQFSIAQQQTWYAEWGGNVEMRCQAIEQIGAPSYSPNYMVGKNGLKPDFNRQLSWKQALHSIECPVAFTGNMLPTHNLGCLKSSQVSNRYNPVDLVNSYMQCLKENNFDDASFLEELIAFYNLFDRARVRDKSDVDQARKALAVLRAQEFDNPEKRKDFSIWERSRNQEYKAKICQDIKRIGIPNYYPRYMTTENGLIPNFDANAYWKKLLEESSTCLSI
jgi:hypothetical protein